MGIFSKQKDKNDDTKPIITLPKRKGGTIACANGHFAVKRLGKWVCRTCDEVLS